MRVATFDLGTNTFRVLIAEIRETASGEPVNQRMPRQSGLTGSPDHDLQEGGSAAGGQESGAAGITLMPIRVLREITRLGQDLHKRTTFHPDAVKRSLAALDRFDREIRKETVDWAGGICTAAFRTAKNGPALLKRIRKRYGWDLRIVSAKQEATYAMRGILHGLRRERRVKSRNREIVKSKERKLFRSASRPHGLTTSRLLVIDIGGGSTEFIVYDRGVRGIETTPLGVVRLTESHLHHDPPLPSEMNLLNAAIDRQLRSVQRHLQLSTQRSALSTFIGTAGTVTTLAALKKRMRHYDPGRITGTRLSRNDLQTLMHRLIAVPSRKRLSFPGMERGREDLILAGIAILLRCMDRFHLRELTVCDSGILEGIALSQASIRLERNEKKE